MTERTHFVYWLYDELAKRLNLKVSRVQLAREIASARNTTLLEIQEKLANWNIRSMGVNLPPEQLDKIPLPAIVQVRSDTSEFCVLFSIEGDTIKLSSYLEGEGSISRHFFVSKWSGVALLLEANENSGDPDFETYRKLELKSRWREKAIWALTLFLFLLFGITWPTFFHLLLLQFAGFSICMALFLKGHGVDTKLSLSTCTPGSSTDCRRIIHSRLGTLFGLFPLSELGLVFFGSTFLTQLISLTSTNTPNQFIGYLFLCSAPLTLILIYYQGVVLKAWCLLCLAVFAILWMLAILTMVRPIDHGFLGTTYFLSGFSFMLLLWLLFRAYLISTAQSRNFEVELNRFRRNRDLFELLLNREQFVDPEIVTDDVVIGKKDAPITVTLVTSPTCEPCAAAHNRFDKLYRSYEDSLQLVYRFAIGSKENANLSDSVSKELINLGMLGSSKLPNAIASWYHQERPRPDDWLRKNAQPQHPEILDGCKRHQLWCSKNGIRSTPSIFIQGRRVSALYSLADIEYYLKQRLVNAKI